MILDRCLLRGLRLPGAPAVLQSQNNRYLPAGRQQCPEWKNQGCHKNGMCGRRARGNPGSRSWEAQGHLWMPCLLSSLWRVEGSSLLCADLSVVSQWGTQKCGEAASQLPATGCSCFFPSGLHPVRVFGITVLPVWSEVSISNDSK